MAAPLPQPQPDTQIVVRRGITLYPPGTIVESRRTGGRGLVLPYDIKYARCAFPVRWGGGVCRLALGEEVTPVSPPVAATVARLE